ncbi:MULTISPECIES: DEAD/DEAH box helicase [Pseudomonas]|uniref:DEAD/DEAH box helicase n=1 Tax=Pseudomonas TaxID=286 RepID=UPI001BE5BB0A|nr:MULTISPECIES: DEAD/DEAH box helicase [Pseudomonas]MBT2341519.1 DEAD/DEAH box helicase [Pseudomonas fluorescens]MCD4531666.1 DEAD/DEAH box helicase [Pseudomonas sp. C3-2018]
MTNSIAEFLEDDCEWLESFGQRELARGFDYADENRIRILEVTERSILAECRGSGRNVYQQVIELIRYRGDDQISYECSCPVGGDCKHCAAVMFYLSGNESALQDCPGGERLGSELENWIQKIPLQRSDSLLAEKSADVRIFYRLKENKPSGVWTLGLFKGHQLDEGKPQDLQAFHALADMLVRMPGFVTDIDMKIGRLLAIGHDFRSPSSNYPLRGRNGAQALALALQSSRLFLAFDPLQPLIAGPERPAQFFWAEQPNGNYRPQWQSHAQVLESVLPLEPLYYLDVARGELGPLAYEMDDGLAGHLCLAPEIPARHAGLFSHRLNALDRQIPPPKELTERVIDDVEPQPVLTLGSYISYSHWRSAPEHRAALTFTYDGHVAHEKASTEVSILSGTETLRIQRKPEAEQALRKVLRKFGFKRASRQSLALADSVGERLQLPDDAAWLAFVDKGLEQLRAANWQIDIEDGFHFNLQPVDALYADIEESPGREWFDLQLGIIVNGERRSLLPILLNLLRTNAQMMDPAYLDQRKDDQLMLIDLNGGKLMAGPGVKVALPYGRVKPLMATLGELYMKEHRGDSIRLNAFDAARLDALDGMPLEWNGGERLRTFAKRLRESTHVHVPAPEGLMAVLRPYQLEGLNWMQTLGELEVGGILGDDMGLGKTLQTLAHLLCEKQAGHLDIPALAVMPTSLIPNWLDEAARFTPQLKVLALHGAARQKDFASLAQYDLVLTTYALLSRDLKVLQPQAWSVLILDEAQNIKNPTSKAAQAARELKAWQRLCLTGTPLENHLGELWSLFHFLLPGWLGDSKTFNRDYRTPIEKHGNSERMRHLAARIKPFLLRRKKEQVATELPPKTEIVHWVDLGDGQRDVYETVRVAMDKKVRDEIARSGVARSQIIILDALLKLRQVCCDLRLLNTTTLTAKALRSGSGKLTSLMEMLEELLSEGRKILLFSQFTSMLALIEEELCQRGLAYSLLTGQTTDRRTPVRDFQSGKVSLFLISLKAGGTGLNLTAADTVIHFDPWWNPAVENQATDRAYRIGQDKPVFVYKLIARGTVEEKIQALQQEKAALVGSVLDGGTTGGWTLEQSDIEALFAPLPKA